MSYRAGEEVIVVMSDATGYGSGGASPILTVGQSVYNVNCDVNVAASGVSSRSTDLIVVMVHPPDNLSDVQFKVDIDNALTQCE